jgi:hypothetical protein
MSPKKFEEKYSKLTERDKKEAHQLRSGWKNNKKNKNKSE